MRLVINHVTRMQPGYICVAGIDVRTNQHVRPVLHRSRLTTDLLARNGGAFDIGRVVDLEPAEPSGSVPEIEDHIFDPGRVVAVEELDPDSFWELLNGIALD